MINTQVLKGNLIRQDYTTAFVLNQGDKGVPFKIELLENGAPYILQSTDIVTIEWLKPNGSPFLQDTGITKGDTYVEITTPEAISQSSGSGTFNIIISDGTTRKGTIRREYKVIPTSMRPGATSEDTITDAITELRNLNTEIASTVQNNQELINNNTAATKSDINSINSSLEDIVNKQTSQIRGIDLYCTHSGYRPLTDFEYSIPILADCGFKSAQLAIGVTCDSSTNTVTQLIPDDITQGIINLLKENGFTYIMLKMHINTKSDDYSINEEYLESYKSLLLKYASIASTNNINSFLISNESPFLTNRHYDKWNEIITEIKKVYSGKISMSMTSSEVLYSDCIELLDIICVNMYPYMSCKGINAELEECISGWSDNLELIKRLKNKYNKPVYITETGCQPRLGRLLNPGVSSLATDLSEETQYKYFKATLPTLCDSRLVDGFFIWEGNYPQSSYSPIGRKAETLIRKYIGGK